MRYYAARQRRNDARWDYTVLIDGLVFPVGYCAGVPDISSPAIIAEFGGDDSELLSDYRAKIENNRDKYHTAGHVTKGEARQCYKRYLLDNDMKLDLSNRDTQHRCLVCGVWTQGMAAVGHHFFILCDNHMKREEIELLMPDVGESWES